MAGIYISAKKAEFTLKVNFPKSYEIFISKFGALSCGSQDIWMVEEREAGGDIKFPSSLVIILELGNGKLSCLKIHFK